ncbi:alanine racemase [Evansella caseinilytica]|uniref:Alanine racemase n=1 Tax=Evansella caseinilytica TaxID=1503961 RepID=A0A1H3TUR0_9BACI|nr:alanine racemase [Evansella caseinilytica]SDZ53974.1 alanine racemase [Evansella caseinilytica]
MDSSSFHRDTWVEIHLDKIESNVRKIKGHLPAHVKFLAVVKADAYGHGDWPVAKTALSAGADGLAVALFTEALQLRQNGIKAPILVLSAISPEDVDSALEHDIAVSVFQTACLEKMLKHKTSHQPLKIHLKIDTGLGRIGLREYHELQQILPLLKSGHVLMEGVYTHFATADKEDTSYYQQQYDKFRDICRWLNKEGVSPSILHCANSAAALRFPDKALDAVRIGLAMVGIYPSENMRKMLPFSLETALSLHSKIVQVKKIAKGSFVGYGNAYMAKADEWIATVPVGYADGWFRCFKGAHVLAGGKRMPIIGTIYMDQLMIRLPEKMAEGTQVTLIGRQGNDEITFYDLARHIGTVPLEIPLMISYRVPRVFYRHGEVTEVLGERLWTRNSGELSARTRKMVVSHS